MVNVKRKSMGSNDGKNELFNTWKRLWAFETGKDPDEAADLDDPWKSYDKAISGGEERRKKRGINGKKSKQAS